MKNNWFYSLLLLPVLFALTGCGYFKGPEGYWYGYVTWKDDQPYRVAVHLEKDPLGHLTGYYDSIDNGLYNGRFDEIAYSDHKLHMTVKSGTAVDLTLSRDGDSMIGTQSPNYPVTLKRGLDFSIPRVGSNGKGVSVYSYQVPQKTDDGWDVEDLRQDGADIQKLESAVDDILGMEVSRVDSLVIVKKGKLALDEYFYGFTRDDEHELRSISKSVFSTLFGIAQGQGLLNTDQKLYDFYPEYRTEKDWKKKKNKITLGMVLTMTSGFACDDWAPPYFSCLAEMNKSPDWVSYALSRPLDHDPGKHFAYCGSCLEPLAAILKTQSGMSVPEYAQTYLYNPMGIKAIRWMSGPRGIVEIEGSHWMKPRDMAKFGLLYLNKGKWNGQQVVPEKWIEDATSVKVPKEDTKTQGGYGYLWWIRPITLKGKEYACYAAEGLGGQFIWVVPDLQLVVVITGSNYQGDNYEAKFKFFQDRIVSALFN